jgi:23S rRNA (guanosine2251-2'-O)-methyltransferase
VVPERRAALEQLVLHATALRIPVVEVEGGSLTALTGFDGHQGIALVVEPRRWATIDDVLARARERGEPPFVLVLDSLEDPQNVGTLLRSAEACGVHGVLFPTRRSAPMGPAAIKASAGAVEHLLLVPLDDLGGGLVDLHAGGLRLVGADESAPLAYRDADLRGPLAIVVGSEGRGIAGHVRRRLDLAVRIPMYGRVASLNAAVAGSVLLFEAAAQRPAPARPSSPPAMVGVADVKAPREPEAEATAEPGIAPEAEADAALEPGASAEPDPPDAPEPGPTDASSGTEVDLAATEDLLPGEPG